MSENHTSDRNLGDNLIFVALPDKDKGCKFSKYKTMFKFSLNV